MLEKKFGNRIKQIRIEKSLSQIDLSYRSGIERAQISKIESGKVNVTLETIVKLANALNVTIPEIFNFNILPTLHPFVKWAGGKKQLSERIQSLMPQTFNRYFEPFVGGGAIFFDVCPSIAYLNDSNEELMCVYRCLQDDKLFKKMIQRLNEHEKNHSEDYYYLVRKMDQKKNFISLPLYERAARLIYLNKACFNGLYRVNSKGYFNVPFGKKEKIITYDRENMQFLHQYFMNHQVIIDCTDFETAVVDAQAGDFVYFDPPYDTLENKNSFTSYSKDSFGKEEQERLAKVFKELSSRGVYVMLSNHNTSFIRNLYKEFHIHIVSAKRNINSDPNGRGTVEEVIITNY